MADDSRYLEGLPEFVAHDGVQQRVDARGQVVEHPGNVRYDDVDVVEVGVLNVHVREVDGHHSLGMERRPAEEEGDDHGHWKGMWFKGVT